MTEEQHIALVAAGDRFWMEFAALVAKTLDSIPDVPEADAVPYLQDKTSIYGCDYEKYRKAKSNE